MMWYYTSLLIVSTVWFNCNVNTQVLNPLDAIPICIPPFSQFSDSLASLVRVDVFYETLCPDCIREFQGGLLALMRFLGSFVDLHTYPYGNAQMRMEKGVIKFDSQHGPAETFGNKLHACAIDYFGSDAAAFEFNSCMMARLSNETAADQCGEMFYIDPEPIKMCAKSYRGDELLRLYGIASAQVLYQGVPANLVNGQFTDSQNLLAAVCNALPFPPPICGYFM